MARLLAIGGTAIAVLVMVSVDWDSPIRVVLTLLFLLFVPGLALGELLEINDPVQRLALASGASLGSETLICVALLYLGLFSAEAAIAIVVSLTSVVLLVAALRGGTRLAHVAPDAENRRAAT